MRVVFLLFEYQPMEWPVQGAAYLGDETEDAIEWLVEWRNRWGDPVFASTSLLRAKLEAQKRNGGPIAWPLLEVGGELVIYSIESPNRRFKVVRLPLWED